MQLGGLRVLALRADQGASGAGPAEFSPGDSVTVTPIISDFNGGGRALTYSAIGCLDPGISYGAEPSCAGNPTATTLGGGAVTLSGAVSSTGQANTFTVSIPATILAGRSALDQYNGVFYLVTYTLTAADGTTTKSFKRLTASTPTKTKNQNPTLVSILANGSAMTTLPSGDVQVSVSYSAGSNETYTTMKSDGSLASVREDLLTTFFVTDGTLKYFRTINDQATTFSPPGAAPVGHQAAIVAVTRDPRGGVSVKVQQLN